MPAEEKSLLTRLVERKPSLYWWTLLNLSVASAAVMSWFYFVPTFNFPEVPVHYERIVDWGRAPKLPAFEAIHAPAGETLSVEQLHSMLSNSEISDSEINQLNRDLLRNYIQSIQFKALNFYLKGTFKVTRARQLDPNDLFARGLAIQARSQRRMGTADRLVPFLVEIELILPGVKKSALQHFPANRVIELHRFPHHASVLNVKRKVAQDGETMVSVSLVPLTTSPPQNFGADLQLNLTIPERIYPANPLPIFK